MAVSLHPWGAGFTPCPLFIYSPLALYSLNYKRGFSMKRLYVFLLTFVLMLFAVPAFASIHIDKVTDMNGNVIPYDSSKGLSVTPTTYIKVYGHTDGETLTSAFGNNYMWAVREVNSSPRYNSDTVGVDNVGGTTSSLTAIVPHYGDGQQWYSPNGTASLSYTSFSPPYSSTSGYTYFVTSFGNEWSGVGNANIRIAIIPSSWGSSNSGMSNVTESTFSQYELGNNNWPVASNIPPRTYDYILTYWLQKQLADVPSWKYTSNYQMKYKISVHVQRVIKNSTDQNDPEVVTGIVNFNINPNQLFTYWTGAPGQIAIHPILDQNGNPMSNGQWAEGSSELYGPDYNSGSPNGGKIHANFMPDKSNYPTMYFDLDPNQIQPGTDTYRWSSDGSHYGSWDSSTSTITVPPDNTTYKPGVNISNDPLSSTPLDARAKYKNGNIMHDLLVDLFIPISDNIKSYNQSLYDAFNSKLSDLGKSQNSINGAYNNLPASSQWDGVSVNLSGAVTTLDPSGQISGSTPNYGTLKFLDPFAINSSDNKYKYYEGGLMYFLTLLFFIVKIGNIFKGVS